MTAAISNAHPVPYEESGTLYSSAPARDGTLALWGGVLALLGSIGMGLLLLFQQPGLAYVALSLGVGILFPTGLLLVALGDSARSLLYRVTATDLQVWSRTCAATVSLAAIDGVYVGDSVFEAGIPRKTLLGGLLGMSMPVHGLGAVRVLATSADVSDLTLIVIKDSGLLVSTADSANFRRRLIRAASTAVHSGAASPTFQCETRWAGAVLADAFAPWCLALAELLLLISVATLSLAFPHLPNPSVLRFDPGGTPTQLGSPIALLRLPQIGLGVLAANWLVSPWVHRQDAVLARLLWLGAAAAELLIAVAMFGLTR